MHAKLAAVRRHTPSSSVPGPILCGWGLPLNTSAALFRCMRQSIRVQTGSLPSSGLANAAPHRVPRFSPVLLAHKGDLRLEY